MFCSYRCSFTNKMTAGEIESENSVLHIWVQNVLIYNIKTSQHAFWNTSKKTSISPRQCALPTWRWMIAVLENLVNWSWWKAVLSIVIKTVFLWSTHQLRTLALQKTSLNFTKGAALSETLLQISVLLNLDYSGLKSFPSSKQNKLLAYLGALQKTEILPRDCKAWCTCGLFALELCKRFELFFEINFAPWELLWGRRMLCNWEGRVRKCWSSW